MNVKTILPAISIIFIAITSGLIYGYDDPEVKYIRDKFDIYNPQPGEDRQTLRQSKDAGIDIGELYKEDRLYQKKISDDLRRQYIPLRKIFKVPQTPLQEVLRAKKINIFIDNFKKLILPIVFLFIAIAAMLALAYRRIFIEEKTLLEDKALGQDLLAIVNNWELSREDFAGYFFKLKASAGEALHNIDTPEFKNHFLKDFVYSEIVYQYSFDRNAQDAALIDLKNNPLIKGAEDKDIRSQLNDYLNYLSRGAPYAAYYDIFFTILFMLDKDTNFKVFELCKKHFFIKKIIDDLSGDILVSENEIKAYCKKNAILSGSDYTDELEVVKAKIKLAKVQLLMGRDLVEKFKRKSKIYIREITV